MEQSNIVESQQNGNNETRKRKSFSIKEKLNILKDLDLVGCPNVISVKYNVPIRTLRGWRKDRPKLEQLKVENFIENDTKRIKTTPFELLEEALYIWFDRSVRGGVSLTGPLLMVKALELHEEMGIQKKFSASEGWLQHWKNKYRIPFYTMNGEKFSVDSEGAETFKKQFQSDIKEEKLELCQIFNVDEAGFYHKIMPEKPLEDPLESSESSMGFKQVKERITILVCSNADGSLKLPLLIVGKTPKPQVLKNISKDTLPVRYVFYKSAWINLNIFEDWFRNEFLPKVSIFLKNKSLPEKAVLLLDNALCHPLARNLNEGNITIKFLPANTNSILQPMNLGIMKNLKRHYKSVFINSILYAQKNNINLDDFIKSIDVQDVVYWMCDAWDNVSASTIFKCWKNLLPSHYYENNNKHTVKTDETELLIQISNDVRQINGYQDIEQGYINDWLNFNDNLIGDEFIVPTNSELIELVTPKTIDENTQNIEDSDRKEITAIDAITAAKTLLAFYEKNNLLSLTDLAVIRKAKRVAMKMALLD